MATLPYMQLYISDYLADTWHLTTEEHGAYLLILMNYWQTGKAVPKNRLSAITRIDKNKWPEIENTLSEFFEDDGEKWTHTRIEKDLHDVYTKPKGKRLPDGKTMYGYNGYIYFIGADDSDLVKIGYSKNPWARLVELKRTTNQELRVVAVVKTVEKSEHNIHAMLNEYHQSGEWFYKKGRVEAIINAINDKEITTVDDIYATVGTTINTTNELRTTYDPTTNIDIDIDVDIDNKIIPSEKFSEDDFDLAHYIFEKICDLNPNHKAPNLEKWASAIRLMRERDKRTIFEIRDLFNWANNHHFWKTNILSPDKLRKQWDRLMIQKQNEQPSIDQVRANLAGKNKGVIIDG